MKRRGRGHRESQSRQKRHKVCVCVGATAPSTSRPCDVYTSTFFSFLLPFFRLFPLTQCARARARVCVASCGGHTKNTRLFFDVCGSRIAKFRHRAPQCTQYRRLISFPSFSSKLYTFISIQPELFNYFTVIIYRSSFIFESCVDLRFVGSRNVYKRLKE